MMRTSILRMAFVLFISPYTWAQTPPPDLQLTNLTIVGGSYETDAPYGMTSEQEVVTPNNYIYKAGHQIRLLPGFKTSLTNNTDKFRAYIAPPTFEVVSMNPDGWTVGKYEKLELGIKVPDSLLNNIQSYFTSTGASGINPYNPDKLKITCTFVNGSQSYTRDAFFYRDFNIQGNIWLEKATPYHFRVRFCPPLTGNWTATFNMYQNGVLQTLPVAYTYSFTVNSSSNKGHLSVDATNTRKFKYDDGTPFYAIAQNLIAFTPYQTPCNDANLDCVTHNTYDTHRGFINDLADNGGNFTRVRLDPNLYPVEKREFMNYTTGTNYFGMNDIGKPLSYFLNNYDNNQKHMWELDSSVHLMENRGMYFMLCLLEDQSFSTSDVYDGYHQYTWDKNPYSTFLGNTNAGCQSFVTDTLAKSLFKKYMAYINARWGYSTNLAAYEMINETQNISSYNVSGGGAQGPYSNDVTFRAHVDSWVCEMKTALQQKYPAHLVTTGTTFVTAGCPNDANGNAVPNCRDNISCLDLWTQNDYRNYSDNITHLYQLWDYVRHSQAKTYFDANMPFIWGELGMPDNSNDIDGFNDRTFHNANWISIMSGALGTGMYWNDMGQNHGTNHRANFNAIKAYVNDVDWTQTWTPYFNISEPDGTKITGSDHAIYTFSAVRGDQKQAIAFSLNKSSHWANEDSSIYNGLSRPHHYDSLLTAQQLYPNQLKYDIDPSVHPNDNPQVEIKGLLNGSSAGFPYKIDVYKTYGSGGMVQQINALCYSTLKFPLDMPFNIGPTNYPDYAFIARSLASFQRQADTLVMTNKDTAYMAPDFIKNPGNYTYTYDWGNGVVSHDTAAAVYYPVAGNYTITLTVTDRANDTSAVYQQAVRIQDVTKKQEAANIGIYPNPSMGSFRMAYDPSLFVNPRIRVYNSLGKVVHEQAISLESVQFPSSSNGLYLVEFYGEGYQKMLKLVIQN